MMLTCRIWQWSEAQSMFSQGWYMPRVTQFSRITMMLILSNHVLKGLRSRSREQDTEWRDGWIDGWVEGGIDGWREEGWMG